MSRVGTIRGSSLSALPRGCCPWQKLVKYSEESLLMVSACSCGCTFSLRRKKIVEVN
jgi:hypothetical protein